MERRMIFSFDWTLIVLIFILAGIGIVNIYSASTNLEQAGTPVHVKQFYWLALGFIVMFAVALIGPQRIAFFAYPIYLAVIVSLIAVLFLLGMAMRWKKRPRHET